MPGFPELTFNINCFKKICYRKLLFLLFFFDVLQLHINHNDNFAEPTSSIICSYPVHLSAQAGKKKSIPKKFLIFQEIELSGSNIKKFLIFQEMETLKSFLYFRN